MKTHEKHTRAFALESCEQVRSGGTNMGRKPTKKDIVRGCMAFLKDMIIAVFLFDFDRAKFDLGMLRITAKGDFEVIDEN